MDKNVEEAIEGSLFCSRTLLSPRVPSVVDGSDYIIDPWIAGVTIKAPEILLDLYDHVFTGFHHGNPKCLYPNSGAQLQATDEANCVRFRGLPWVWWLRWRGVSMICPVR